ncbi:hypothetical protein EBR43_03615 [bacterium]|nr:hypothetical protein [bacterium]NBW56867.1 hypothetical protein [bacterium]NBX71546.1 hypothetical protein [bacterium]
MLYKITNVSIGTTGKFSSIYQVANYEHLVAKIINEAPDGVEGSTCAITSERQAYCVYRELYAHYKMGSLNSWFYDHQNRRYCLMINKDSGKTLDSCFKRDMSYDEYYALLKASHNALDDFHKKTGLIHGDTRCGHIIYDENDSTAKLVEFGYSRCAGFWEQYGERIFLSLDAFKPMRTTAQKLFNDPRERHFNKYVFYSIAHIAFYCIIKSSSLSSELLILSLLMPMLPLVYLGVSVAYKKLDDPYDSENKTILISCIIASSFLYAHFTGALLYFLSKTLSDKVVLESLSALSTSQLALFIFPFFTFQATFHACNIFQMLKTCYGLAEELFDSFLMPKSFIHKKAEFFVGKPLDQADIDLTDIPAHASIYTAAPAASMRSHAGRKSSSTRP